MNRKAQITLDNVYPKRVGTNTLIKDVDELLLMNFTEKLRKITVKKNAKFVDYRPETGSWVFKVDHFSKYGYNDSDEEAEASSHDPAVIKKPEITHKSDEKRDKNINLELKQDSLTRLELAKTASQVRIIIRFFMCYLSKFF